MVKKQDFFGKDITSAIEDACTTLAVHQEQLDIEVIETGSTGIFGLCRKKAHIRAAVKGAVAKNEPRPAKVEQPTAPAQKGRQRTERPVDSVPAKAKESKEPPPERKSAPVKEEQTAVPSQKREQKKEVTVKEEVVPAEETASTGPVEQQVEPPSEETRAAAAGLLIELLALMGFPSEVKVTIEKNGLLCHVTGTHEEEIIGHEGRTLDSLQYLVRKMMSRQLPDRAILTIDVGDFRERRAEELKQRALELAEQVQADGKTQAIPALNPSERRVVHMALQDSRSVRSRSVGDGLFKKVLIYKPSKSKKNDGKKRKGRHGSRPTDD